MKKRTGFLLLALGAFSFLVSGATSFKETPNFKNEDTTFLLTLDNSLCGNDQAVKENQNTVLARLRNVLGYKFTLEDRYTQASNTLKIRANSELKDLISRVYGVSKVNENNFYRFGDFQTADKTNVEEGYIVNFYPELEDKDIDNLELQPEQLINYSAQNMHAPISESESNLGKGTLIAILDASFMINHSWFKDLEESGIKYSKADMLNFQNSGKLHGAAKNGVEQGKLGSTYHNNKIPFYYDYGGDSLHNGKNDYDVLSRWDQHGTHVAGIAAANGIYHGIAPNAQLALMKVFRETIQTSSGVTSGGVGAYDADILEALEDCVVLGVDVVNMSLGSDLDDFSNRSSSMAAFETLRNRGCVVSISAGNDGKENYSSMGPYANWTTDMVETGILGSYANDASSMIVASTTLEKNYYEDALIINLGDKTQPTNYKDQARTAKSPNDTPDDLKFSTLATKFGDYITYCYIGTQSGAEADDILGSSSAFNTFKAKYKEINGVDLDASNKIAVVDRGDISFSNKAKYAKEAGFAGLVVVNNDPTALEFNFSMAWGDSTGYQYPEIPVVFVLNRDKEYFKKGVGSDGCGTLSIAKKKIAENPDKNQVAGYSSDGATYDLRLNPDISAPGSNVLSCVPGLPKNNSEYNGAIAYYDKAWAYMDGTSMAAPNFSGASALILSDLTEGETKENRQKIAKTIPMREMSTADQYTYTNKKVVDISTGATEDDGTVEYSPRRQGAGEVNIRDTINTKVYLESLKVNQDGTFSKSLMNKAKIELKNNDLIKEGKLNLSFVAHSLSDKDITYNAKIRVLKPRTEPYYNYENHKEDNKVDEFGKPVEPTRQLDYEYEGYTFQTTKDDLVHEKSLGQVTVKANGDTTLKFEDSLSDEEKKEINEMFTSGTYLEGYVYLTPVDTNEVDLSIPFMGFYGDYGKAPAIEEFDFVRDTVDENNNKIYYPSDLVNYIGRNTGLSLKKMDVSSTICGMNYDTYYSLKSSNDVLTNKGSVKNASQVVTYNKETNTIYAGGAQSEVLYLQAFVLRSIESNTITIRDANGKVVNTIGDKCFTDAVLNTTYLYKSHVSASYINSGIICHRAEAFVPLYQASNKNLKLTDGNYTIELSFKVLGSQTVQTKKFNLVIDSLAPSIQSKSYITKNGEKYVRVKYQETYMTRENNKGKSVIAVNGGVVNCDISEYNGGYYIDFKVSDVLANDPNGKVSIDITDGSGNVIFDMFYIENENADDLIIESNKLVPGSTLKITKEDLEADAGLYDFSRKYKVIAYDFEGNTIKESEFGIYKVVLSSKDAIDVSSVTVTDKNGKELVYKVNELSTLTFEVSTREFTVKFNKGAGLSVNTTNNMVLILGLSIGIPGAIIVAAVAVVLYLFVFKKKAK